MLRGVCGSQINSLKNSLTQPDKQAETDGSSSSSTHALIQKLCLRRLPLCLGIRAKHCAVINARSPSSRPSARSFATKQSCCGAEGRLQKRLQWCPTSPASSILPRPDPTQPNRSKSEAWQPASSSLFQGWPLYLGQLPSKGPWPCPKAQAHSPSLCPAVSERDGRARGT